MHSVDIHNRILSSRNDTKDAVYTQPSMFHPQSVISRGATPPIGHVKSTENIKVTNEQDSAA